MKAVVYRGIGDIGLEDVPRPQIQGPEDAIVRVTTTSICGSDLHILRGYLGLEPGTIVGHEFTGVVEEVGSAVTKVKPGDRVLGAAGVWCGRCPACRKNLGIACEHVALYGCGPLYGNLQGVQAEYVRVLYADATLEKIPEDLTDEQVLFVGDILSTAYMAARGMNPCEPGIQPGSVVAIFGAGPVGLCAVSVARLFGPAKIIAVDMEDYRLNMATRLGADHVINASREDPTEAIMEITGKWGADYVIEAIGSPEAFDQCLTAVAAGGTVFVIGVFQEPVEVPIQFLMSKNISIKMGLANLIYMKELIALIQNGKLDLTPIITHRLPLAEAEKGYELFKKRLDGAIKVIFKP